MKKIFLNLLAKPTYITHNLFGKDYTAIHEIKPIINTLNLILNKPTYIGLNVLDLSKWKMYDFHYNFLKKNLMLNCYLLTQTEKCNKIRKYL